MSGRDDFITIERLSKHFGLVRAVDEVDMQIREGEFFSLLGPSGCGKTTLLRMLAGFEVPTAGEIYIDGAAMAAVPPHHRPTNMVFQNYAIFPHLDVRQNIAYGLRSLKLDRAEIDRRVREMLEVVKLPGFERRRADELSGGQRQRVALARALVRRPKVLLLDEPLGALDKKLREEMQLELRALQQSLGITFVFVTHDQEEAMTLSDRIAVMSSGKVLQMDTPEKLYEAPNSREVAAFIGTMNFLPARIVREEGEAAEVELPGGARARVMRRGAAVSPGGTVTLGIRPEKLSLALEAPSEGVNRLQGRLAEVSYLGDRSHYYVEVEGIESRIAVASQNDLRQLDIYNRLDYGHVVWVTWSPAGAVILTR